MPWWGWIILGALVLGSELMFVDAAFYLVFIGIAAFLTGLLGLVGAPLTPWAQWLVFAVLAVICMVLFRKRLYEKFRGGIADYEDSATGETLRLEEDLPPGESCRMEFRGTTWTVVNSGTVGINAGQFAKISRIEGLSLIVESVDQGS